VRAYYVNGNFFSIIHSASLLELGSNQKIKSGIHAKTRVKEAFRENAVSGEIITFIARNTAKYGNGDARYALLLLLSAGFATDRDEQSAISPEHVREVQEKTDPKIRDEDLTMHRKMKSLYF